MRRRKVLFGENQWWPLDPRIVQREVPERTRGVYMIGDSDGTVIYAGESAKLRDALREHAEDRSEQAACLESHGADRFLFTVVGARPAREGELQELLDFYRPPCNRG